MKKKITDKELQAEIKSAQSLRQQRKIRCDTNLYVIVHATGTVSWIYKIRSGSTKAFGTYPEMSLREAFAYAQRCRKEDNSVNSKVKKFAEVKENYLKTKLPNEELERSHKNKKFHDNQRSLLKHLTELDKYNLTSITPQLVDEIITRQNLSQGGRNRTVCALNNVLNLAVQDGYLVSNPCQYMTTRGSFAFKYGKSKTKGFKFCMPEELGEKFFYKLINQSEINRVFYLFLCMSALRVGSVLALEWEWIDEQNKCIWLPGYVMKNGKNFDLTMTPFIIALLKYWKKTCETQFIESPYVFYSKRSYDKPKNPGDVNVPITSIMHKELTLHGLRKTFRTWASQLMYDRRAAEYALSHQSENKIEAIYDHNNFFLYRMDMLSCWNYFIYTKLPKEFKELMPDLDVNKLQEMKNVYDLTVEKARAFAHPFNIGGMYER